ncbi:MAG TPA: hypothetical protein PKE39_14175 [Ignavibacteria bacterium]|nr:hypothetical protein [Ignavibacteria bacterium]HMR00165.1 hypothetical protein [Ignavibacteria bacterium]
MNSKLNIEEIQLMIPDYISGELSGKEKALVDSALKESAELRQFYSEMKETFNFVSSVKFTEPAPQYWNSLLPRIHEKIESREPRAFSWDKVSAIWKVLVPIAAVIFIALVYYIVKPTNTQLTEDKKIENIKKDSSKDNDNNPKEEKQVEKQNENNLTNEQDKSTEKQNNIIKRDNIKKDNNIVKDEEKSVNNNDVVKESIKDEQLAVDVDIEETSIFASGEAAGFDEETENELKNLNDTEQSQLLDEIINSNL